MIKHMIVTGAALLGISFLPVSSVGQSYSAHAADPLGYYQCNSGCVQAQADLRVGDLYNHTKRTSSSQCHCLHLWAEYYYSAAFGKPAADAPPNWKQPPSCNPRSS